MTDFDAALKEFVTHNKLQGNMKMSQWKNLKTKLFHTLGYGGTHPGEEAYSPNARGGEVAECFQRVATLKRRPQSAKVQRFRTSESGSCF